MRFPRTLTRAAGQVGRVSWAGHCRTTPTAGGRRYTQRRGRHFSTWVPNVCRSPCRGCHALDTDMEPFRERGTFDREQSIFICEDAGGLHR